MTCFWISVCNWQLWLASSLLRRRRGAGSHRRVCDAHKSLSARLGWFGIDISHASTDKNTDWQFEKFAQLVTPTILLNSSQITWSPVLAKVSFCFADLVTCWPNMSLYIGFWSHLIIYFSPMMINNLIHYSMQQNRPWESNSSTAGLKIIRLLWNSKFNHRVFFRPRYQALSRAKWIQSKLCFCRDLF